MYTWPTSRGTCNYMRIINNDSRNILTSYTNVKYNNFTKLIRRYNAYIDECQTSFKERNELLYTEHLECISFDLNTIKRFTIYNKHTLTYIYSKGNVILIVSEKNLQV